MGARYSDSREADLKSGGAGHPQNIHVSLNSNFSGLFSRNFVYFLYNGTGLIIYMFRLYPY